MSTDWGIGCRTCKANGKALNEHFTGEWDNFRDVEYLISLCDAAPEVIAISAKLGDGVSFSPAYSSELARDVGRFFREHAGHDLAPMNEYGDFHDQCGKTVRCGGCEAVHSCTLMKKHEGLCK